MNKKPNVYAFISYSSTDRQVAKELYDTLSGKRFHIPCWLDVINIDRDEVSFQQQIVSGIQNASCLVLVDTRDAALSNYVQRELDTAKKHHVPVIHFKVSDKRPSFAKKLQFTWLAQRIRFRITQPYWVSLTLLITLLIAMFVIVTFLGTKTVPAVQQAYQRILPEAVWINAEAEYSDIDPKEAAPFRYDPPNKLLSDDFVGDDKFDQNYYDYEQFVAEDLLSVSQSGGSLNLFVSENCIFDQSCYYRQLMNGPKVNLQYFQYFGIRLRSLENNPYQVVAIALGAKNTSGVTKGFGWEFNNNVSGFFRSDSTLPETGFAKSIILDEDWHAYEIFLDEENELLYFYIDGKLLGNYALQFYDEWETAPLYLRFTIERIYQGEETQLSDTAIQIDQIVLGGFQ
ncbi:MAG TPA: hypothetical protein DCK95_02530 [Anaerolineaceae bacterium]|nr:hypothetical protein [Anaerolineaceae bacterium]